MTMRSLVGLSVFYVLRLNAADPAAVVASAHNVSVTRTQTSDSDYVSLAIVFDATVKGPEGSGLRLATEPVVYTRVEQLMGEAWTTVLEPMRVATTPARYRKCQVVKSGELFEFPRVRTDAVLKKASEGSRVVLRFWLAAACLADDGHLVNQRLVTAPLNVDVPQ